MWVAAIGGALFALVATQAGSVGWAWGGVAVATLAVAGGWRWLLEGTRHELAGALGVAWLLAAASAPGLAAGPLATWGGALLAGGAGLTSLAVAATGRPLRRHPATSQSGHRRVPNGT